MRVPAAADEATWVRGRGWVLWKSMIVLVGALKDDPEDARQTKHVIEEVLADGAPSGPVRPASGPP